jgi:5-carboxymethyl-2-hydroxymuconate isomerase
MPHFVIEYAREVEAEYDINKVMQIAFDSGVASGVMQAADIKVRARPYDYFLMHGKVGNFLHVTVFLLAGRTDTQKEHVSLLLRKNLTAYLETVTSISVDIRDMNTVAYKKRLLSADDT